MIQIQEEIQEATLDFVGVVNKVGPRCVGVVFVVVFEDTSYVIPVIDRDMRVVSGEDPIRALVDQSAAALLQRLEMMPSSIPESVKNLS
jgi:hypothetical protein